VDDIAALLAEQFEEQKAAGQFDAQLDDFMVSEVVPVWKSYAPVDTGEYKDSIQVTQPAEGGRGEVSATDDIANLIEYGTVDTPEFAPAAKTVEHFTK
jgi:hypothetical protein